MVTVVVLVGIFTGFASGFFGIGGGSILVTAMTAFNYDLKTAIGVSIIQMMFSSSYATFLNTRKGIIPFRRVLPLVIAGLIGGYFSSFITANVNVLYLKILFVTIVFLSLVKLLFFKNIEGKKVEPRKNIFAYIAIGLFTGIIGSSIGLGGGIIIVPLLITTMNFDPKEATATGTFFVVFSAFGHLVASLIHGHNVSMMGVYIGLASLVGTYFGARLLYFLNSNIQKKLAAIFYLIILITFATKNF